MIEGRRQLARKRRRTFTTLTFGVMVSGAALLLTGAAQEVQAYPAHRVGALVLVGWLIAIGGIYLYRPPR